jgi:hypothetical protein
MPLRYEIHKPVLRFITEGDVDYNDGLAQLKRSLQEARRVSHEATLWDVVFDITQSIEIRSETELRGIAMALAQHKHMLTGRMAVVVADAYHGELGRTFSVFAEELGHEPRVFDRLEDAEAWLKAERAKS